MVSCKITEEQSFEGQSVTCQERGDRGKTLMGLRSAIKSASARHTAGQVSVTESASA